MPVVLQRLPAPEAPVPPAPLPGAVVTWTSPSGVTVPLTDPSLGWWVRTIEGLGSAPRSLTTAPRAQGGVRLRHQRLDVRRIILGIVVVGETPAEIDDRWRHIEAAIASTDVDRPGVLTVAYPGRRRHIDAYYESGLDRRAEGAVGYDADAVTLMCPDPLWRADPIVIEWMHEEPVDFFDDDYPALSSSAIAGAREVYSPGDVPAMPTTYITGPVTQLIAAIDQDEWHRQYTVTPPSPLGAGETITITADPIAVIGPNGELWTEAIDWSTGRPWPIPPGRATVTITATGAVPGATQVRMAWAPRYRVP